MEMDIGAGRLKNAPCASGFQLYSLRELDRRSARNSLREDDFNSARDFAQLRESGDRKLSGRKGLRGGLGNGRVADVADLAMALVRTVCVRVIHALRDEYAHGQHHKQRKDPFCGHTSHL